MKRAEFVNAHPLLEKPQITLTVRPEKFVMTHWVPPPHPSDPAEVDGHLALNGIVSDSVYIGTDTRYRIQLHNGDNVAVQLRSISQTKHGDR